MATPSSSPTSNQPANKVGLTRADYRGANNTLCQGCGHSSIANQIMSVLYELDVVPETLLKFSGIGCSSKSPTYISGRSFGFNGLHGRMPSLALGAMFADTSLKGIAVSGDGDTASIGMGQFKHLMRRNLPLVYLVENNGVYGLTKGQFSATAEKGLEIKKQGINQYLPVDICLEALVANATFIARSFAGDPKQVKELLKAAFNHHGIAVIDIISPCVTFHNQEHSIHSYTGGKQSEIPLHDISFIQSREEINVEDFNPGSIREITLFDGSILILKKLNHDYDPTNRSAAFVCLEESSRQNQLVTGLIYIDTTVPSMYENYNLPLQPLNRLPVVKLRPPRETFEEVNKLMF